MFKVARKFTFSIAHILDNHDGKCKNLHGHNYKLLIELEGNLIPTGAKEGMVIDFAELKNIVKEKIINILDHSFIYNKNSVKESKIAELLEELNSKTFALDGRSTEENIAKYIYETLQKDLTNLSLVRLWETDSSYCEYRKD